MVSIAMCLQSIESSKEIAAAVLPKQLGPVGESWGARADRADGQETFRGMMRLVCFTRKDVTWLVVNDG
jgi:hypothetical protein